MTDNSIKENPLYAIKREEEFLSRESLNTPFVNRKVLEREINRAIDDLVNPSWLSQLGAWLFENDARAAKEGRLSALAEICLKDQIECPAMPEHFRKEAIRAGAAISLDTTETRAPSSTTPHNIAFSKITPVITR